MMSHHKAGNVTGNLFIFRGNWQQDLTVNMPNENRSEKFLTVKTNHLCITQPTLVPRKENGTGNIT